MATTILKKFPLVWITRSLSKISAIDSTFIHHHFSSTTRDNLIMDGNRDKKSGKMFQILVEGNIGSGKTTFLDIFSRSCSLKQQQQQQTSQSSLPFIVPEPISAWRNVNGQNVFQLLANDPERWCFTFQSYVQLTMAKNHALAAEDGRTLKLMERSIFSARYCFVENLRQLGLLKPVEFHILDHWFKALVPNISVDMIIYLRTDPDVVFERIQQRARPEEARLTRDYLRSLHELHEAWLVEHRFDMPRGCRVVTIDANEPLDKIVHVYNEKTSNIIEDHRSRINKP